MASNFSDFFFRFHFHGLNNLPNVENLLTVAIEFTALLSKGDDGIVHDPTLFVLIIVPFLPGETVERTEKESFYTFFSKIEELTIYKLQIGNRTRLGRLQ